MSSKKFKKGNYCIKTQMEKIWLQFQKELQAKIRIAVIKAFALTTGRYYYKNIGIFDVISKVVYTFPKVIKNVSRQMKDAFYLRGA